jgi:hypothetical protein
MGKLDIELKGCSHETAPSGSLAPTAAKNAVQNLQGSLSYAAARQLMCCCQTAQGDLQFHVDNLLLLCHNIIYERAASVRPAGSQPSKVLLCAVPELC